MRLEEIIVTERLFERPKRAPNHAAENRALVSLGKRLSRKPDFLFKQLVDITMGLCKAGSAGLSLISQDQRGQEFFKWVATSGAYASFKDGSTPREMSPCGVCLARGVAQLYDRPARFFTDFKDVQPAIVEGLVVPIYVGSRPVGTIWIVSHTPERKFDSEDVRIMESIGGFVAAALLRSEIDSELRSSEGFNRTILWNTPDCIKVLDADGKLLYLNEPGARLLGIKNPGDALNKSWFGLWPAENQKTAKSAFTKARPGKPARFQGLCPTHAGENKWWDVIVVRLPGKDGRTLVISRDITRQKSAEDELKTHAAHLEDRVAERTKELHTLNLQLQRLSRKLLKSQEDERHHIANELHDEMGQHLTGLKLVLEGVSARSANQNEELNRAQQVVATLMRQVRDLSFDLRQSLPDHINLVTALDWHFKKLKQDQNLIVRFDCKDKVEGVPPDVTRTLFRLVQEALTNVARHSGTNHASVALGVRAEHVRVSIADRGCGFDPHNVGIGNGLRGMRERILLSGGTFDLKTKSTLGTHIEVDIPITTL